MNLKELITEVNDRRKKPDHPFWRKVGNAMIYVVIPAGETVALFLPTPASIIVGASVSVLSVVIKGISKLTTNKKSND